MVLVLGVVEVVVEGNIYMLMYMCEASCECQQNEYVHRLFWKKYIVFSPI
jgi:hypothetical protein